MSSTVSDKPNAWAGFLQALLLLVAALVLFIALLAAGRLSLSQPFSRRADVASTLQALPAAPPPLAPAPAPAAAVAADAMDLADAGSGNAAAATVGRGNGDDTDGDDEDDLELERATRLVDDGDSMAALDLLKEILARNPQHENALVEKAMIELLDLKQPEMATKSLQTALAVNPQNQIALSELVGLYQEQGKTEQGLAFLQEQSLLHPGSPDLAFGIGSLLAASGKGGDANAYLEKAAESTEHGSQALHMLGENYLVAGDTEKAIDMLSRSIVSQEREIDAQEADGYPVDYARERLAYSKMDKAEAYLKHGDLDQAQRMVEDAQKTIPTDPGVDAMLKTLAERRGG